MDFAQKIGVPSRDPHNKNFDIWSLYSGSLFKETTKSEFAANSSARGLWFRVLMFNSVLNSNPLNPSSCSRIPEEILKPTPISHTNAATPAGSCLWGFPCQLQSLADGNMRDNMRKNCATACICNTTKHPSLLIMVVQIAVVPLLVFLVILMTVIWPRVELSRYW